MPPVDGRACWADAAKGIKGGRDGAPEKFPSASLSSQRSLDIIISCSFVLAHLLTQTCLLPPLASYHQPKHTPTYPTSNLPVPNYSSRLSHAPPQTCPPHTATTHTTHNTPPPPSPSAPPRNPATTTRIRNTPTAASQDRHPSYRRASPPLACRHTSLRPPPAAMRAVRATMNLPARRPVWIFWTTWATG